MALTYNLPRLNEKLLARYKDSPPSFTINLYDDHWTLNKGPSKFLYSQPVSVLLEDVRLARIPVDFIEIFDMANVPYYEGCMIVEQTDHRKPFQQNNLQTTQKEPEPARTVLHPNAETLYTDICLLNDKYGGGMTNTDALELESKILTAISPPLMLEPDINYTRIVNSVVRKTTVVDSALKKRKRQQEPEEDENDKAKRAKLLSQYMHPHNGKPSTLTGNKRSLFDVLHEVAQRDEKGQYKPKPKPVETVSTQPTVTQPPRLVPTPVTQLATAVVQPPAMPSSVPPKKVEPPKKPELTESLLAKVRLMTSQVPAHPPPSPAPNDPSKMAPPPARTPIVPAVTPSPAQYQPPNPQSSVSPHHTNPQQAVATAPALNQVQKKNTVAPKKEEQPGPGLTVHPTPATQAIPPATWQQPAPSTHYLPQSVPAKNKPAVQTPQPPPQSSPYPARPPLPAGYAYPQNTPAAYKGPQAQGMVQQHPNPVAARNSPMANPQPLLNREPLQSHSQSPHPPQQQPPTQQAAPVQSSPAPQHQMPRPTPQQQQLLMQARFMSQHAQAMGQHLPQPNVQQQANPRPGTTTDPSQPNQPMVPMPYNIYQYPAHMQGMINGMRMANMPGVQGPAGQYMATAQGWGRVAAGRGAPMPNIPLNAQHYQLMAAMRAQSHQHQQHQQHPANQQHQANTQR